MENTATIKLHKDSDKIPIQKRVRKGDTLFIRILEKIIL